MNRGSALAASAILALPLMMVAWSPPASAATTADGPVLISTAALGHVRFDPQDRMVHIGSASHDGLADAPAHITVDRASDLVGQPLKLIVTRGGPVASPTAGLARPNGLPLRAFLLTSGFGMREHPILGGWRAHAGVDLAATTGSPVSATMDGLVTAAGWAGGYGQFVAIDQGRGVETRYGHMTGLNVSAGQRVRAGDIIGYVGSTGRSTGPHLHYEVRLGGRPVDPLSLSGTRRR